MTIHYEFPIDASLFNAPKTPSYQDIVIGRDKDKFLKQLTSFSSNGVFVFGFEVEVADDINDVAGELLKSLSNKNMGLLMSAKPIDGQDNISEFVNQVRNALKSKRK